MKKVRAWCGQPLDLGRLKNRIGLGHVIDSVLFAFARGRLSRGHLSVCLIACLHEGQLRLSRYNRQRLCCVLSAFYSATLTIARCMFLCLSVTVTVETTV